jgi:hypothetical protein
VNKRIIPKEGRICLRPPELRTSSNVFDERIKPEGEVFDLNTASLLLWAARLVHVHGDATMNDVGVPSVPRAVLAVDTSVAELAAGDVKPESRSRKGRAE